MSMVDLELMHALLRAMRPGSRLVMVGDADQLPSVGAGNVFGDLIRSGTIPVAALHLVFRQAEQSAIIRNAHVVNNGQAPDLSNGQSDSFFLCRRSPDRLVRTVVELCARRLPENMGIEAEDIQVISPTRRGPCGTAELNRALQESLNPPAPGKRQKIWGDAVFREGDRVMQNKNNYDVVWEKDDGDIGTGVFNGDVGTIREIDASGELITIRFDDRTCVYTPDMLSQLDVAYAITVHKAQGSEYRAVVLVSAPAAPGLMVRGVLYTAITRARELLVLVGDDMVPGQMAANDRRQKRYSGLRRRLIDSAS
jgi:exodeoxyribonuclease V alpha subunit